MTVALDPIRQVWAIINPADCRMVEAQSISTRAYTRFETGRGCTKILFSLAYNNAQGNDGQVDVTKPGTVYIHWSKGNENNHVHWQKYCQDFIEANAIVADFLRQLPTWLEPKLSDW